MREWNVESPVPQSPTIQIDNNQRGSHLKGARKMAPTPDGSTFVSAGLYLQEEEEKHAASSASSSDQTGRLTSLIPGLDRKLSSVPLAIEPVRSNDSDDCFKNFDSRQQVVLETIDNPGKIDYPMDNATAGTASTSSNMTASSNGSRTPSPLNDESKDFQPSGRERRDSASSLYPELSSVRSILDASDSSDLLAMNESFSSLEEIQPAGVMVKSSKSPPTYPLQATTVPIKHELSEPQANNSLISSSGTRRNRPQYFLSPTLQKAKANLRPLASRPPLANSTTEQKRGRVDGSFSSMPGAVAIDPSDIAADTRRSRSRSATRKTLSQLEAKASVEISRTERQKKMEALSTTSPPSHLESVNPDASSTSPRRRSKALLRKTLRQLEASFSSSGEGPFSGRGRQQKEDSSFSSTTGGVQEFDGSSSFSSIPGAVAIESDDDVGTPRARSSYSVRKTLRQLEDMGAGNLQSPGAFSVSPMTGIEQRSSCLARQSLSENDSSTSSPALRRSVLENSKTAVGRTRHCNSSFESGRTSLPPRLPFDPAQEKISALELAPGIEDESRVQQERKDAQRHSLPASFASIAEGSFKTSTTLLRPRKSPFKNSEVGTEYSSELKLAPGIESEDSNQGTSPRSSSNSKTCSVGVDLEDPEAGRASMPGAVENIPGGGSRRLSSKISTRNSEKLQRASHGGAPDNNEGCGEAQIPVGRSGETGDGFEGSVLVVDSPRMEDMLERRQRVTYREVLGQISQGSYTFRDNCSGASEGLRFGRIDTSISGTTGNRECLTADVESPRGSYIVPDPYLQSQAMPGRTEEHKSSIFSRIASIVCSVILTAVITSVVFLSANREKPSQTLPSKLQGAARFEMIREVLGDSVSAVGDLDNVNSAQYAALTWIANEDELSPIFENSEEGVISNLRTRYIFSLFYHSLGGPGWIKSENWLEASVGVCAWQFVNCTESGALRSIGPIISNNLRGHLPSELQHLSTLRSLSLPKNFISGFGVLGGQLEELNLSGNNLKGEIPEDLFRSTALEHLNLDSNDLSGTMPTLISDLSALQTFSMHQTGFKGRLSVELLPLKELRSLDLSLTFVEANFTEFVQGLTKLELINLDLSTGISGSIPKDISAFSNLEYLLLAGTGMGGSLPDELGDLTNLVGFAAGRTHISGSIPPSIGRLTNLERFGMEDSLISGSIPTEIGDVSKLEFLNLDNTIVNSTLPSEIGKLSMLEEIHLLSTMLTGTLPSNMANLRSLVSLSIAGSLLEGDVPIGICALPDVLSICVGNEDSSSSVECNCGDICQCPWE